MLSFGNPRTLSVLALAMGAIFIGSTARVAAKNAPAPKPPASGNAPQNDPDPVAPVPITRGDPPATNAYDLYVQAMEAIKDIRYDNPELALSSADKQAIIDKNGDAFRLVREAGKYPFQAPPIRTFDIDMSSFSSIRSLARLLKFRSDLQGQQGKWPEAAESALDAIALGVKIQQDGPMIQTLVGNSVEAIGRKPLADALPHLNSQAAIAAAAHLARIEAERPSYASVLREEEMSSEASVLEVMRDQNQWASFLKAANFTSAPPTRQSIMDLYVKYMNKAIAAAEKPYSSSAKPVPHDKGMDDMESVGDPIYRVKFIADQADNALLIAQLGLQAHRSDNGGYPDKLSELVPTYLASVPADPFAASGPIRYVKAGSAYILYSIGPDGKDNGGAPIDDPALAQMDETGRLRHIVTVTSKGDVVAGVNTF